MRFIQKAIFPLFCLGLFPLTSWADGGDVAGAAAIGFYLFTAVWSCLTIVVFFLTKRRPGPAALFFFSPVLILLLVLLVSFAIAISSPDSASKSKITRETMTLYGATFPPGSVINYDQLGGFFGWGGRQKLTSIESSQPVLLGRFRIEKLLLSEPGDRDIRVWLSEGEKINGLPCGQTTLRLDNDGPVFRGCFLREEIMWHGKLALPGSYVGPVVEEVYGLNR